MGSISITERNFHLDFVSHRRSVTWLGNLGARTNFGVIDRIEKLLSRGSHEDAAKILGEDASAIVLANTDE